MVGGPTLPLQVRSRGVRRRHQPRRRSATGQGQGPRGTAGRAHELRLRARHHGRHEPDHPGRKRFGARQARDRFPNGGGNSRHSRGRGPDAGRRRPPVGHTGRRSRRRRPEPRHRDAAGRGPAREQGEILGRERDRQHPARAAGTTEKPPGRLQAQGHGKRAAPGARDRTSEVPEPGRPQTLVLRINDDAERPTATVRNGVAYFNEQRTAESSRQRAWHGAEDETTKNTAVTATGKIARRAPADLRVVQLYGYALEKARRHRDALDVYRHAVDLGCAALPVEFRGRIDPGHRRRQRISGRGRRAGPLRMLERSEGSRDRHPGTARRLGRRPAERSMAAPGKPVHEQGRHRLRPQAGRHRPAPQLPPGAFPISRSSV